MIDLFISEQVLKKRQVEEVAASLEKKATQKVRATKKKAEETAEIVADAAAEPFKSFSELMNKRSR